MEVFVSIKISENNDTRNFRSCWASYPCNPKRKFHRYLVFILICFISLGISICVDNPFALQSVIVDELGFDIEQYVSLFAWYSWPNVFTSVIGGFLVDRYFGIRLGTVIFSVLILIGQLLFAGGTLINSYGLCAFGRFVFGLGGESLLVIQFVYASAWFHLNELNFVFGIIISVFRLGFSISAIVMLPLYNVLSGSTNQKLSTALYITSTACLFSVFCAVALGWFDRRRVRFQQNCTQVDDMTKISLSDILKFPASLWFIAAICATYYAPTQSFISLSEMLFIQKFVKSSTDALMTMNNFNLVSLFACPLIGMLIDLLGRNILWMLAGVSMTAVCHFLIAFSYLRPDVTMVLMGLSYSMLATSLWPLVVYIVPCDHRCTAFGLVQSVQNFALACTPVLASFIQIEYGFLMLEVFFLMCLCLALYFVLRLYLWDMDNESVLNCTGDMRRSVGRTTKVAASS